MRHRGVGLCDAEGCGAPRMALRSRIECPRSAAPMRWGQEERVQAAVDKIAASSALFIHSDDTYSWLLARLTAGVVDACARTSLRRQLEPLDSRVSSVGRVALDRYLRQTYLSC